MRTLSPPRRSSDGSRRAPRARSFPGRTWALGAAAIAGGATIIFGWLVANEATGSDAGRVAAVFALFLSATACAAGAAVLGTPEARHLSAAAGTGLLVSLGVLALSSIGLVLLVAAGMLIMAIAAGRADRRTSSRIRVIAAFVLGAALPFALVSLI
jgi:hypothetical protein